jgi:hypothetical protein
MILDLTVEQQKFGTNLSVFMLMNNTMEVSDMGFFGFGMIKPHEVRDCGKYTKKLCKLLDANPEELTLTIHKNGESRINVELHFLKSCVAFGTLVMMPGCCGLLVSTGAYVNTQYRHKGIGRIMHKIRQDIGAEAGFSCMICTDVMSNKPQQKILSGERWKLVHKFLNRNTGNKVGIHIINLKECKDG